MTVTTPPQNVTPTTRLYRHTNDALYLRGRDLVAEVVGHMSFTQALFLYHRADEVIQPLGGKRDRAPRLMARKPRARICPPGA